MMEKLKWQYFVLILVIFVVLGILSVYMKPQKLTDQEVSKADSNRYEILKQAGQDSLIKRDSSHAANY